MKILGRRIDYTKVLKGDEKAKLEEKTEKIYQEMKREEENDAKEAQDDMMIDLMSGGLI